VSALIIAIRKFRKAGLGRAVVEKMVTMLHPPIMSNVRIDAKWRLTLKSKRYRWVRRQGWEAR